MIQPPSIHHTFSKIDFIDEELRRPCGDKKQECVQGHLHTRLGGSISTKPNYVYGLVMGKLQVRKDAIGVNMEMGLRTDVYDSDINPTSVYDSDINPTSRDGFGSPSYIRTGIRLFGRKKTFWSRDAVQSRPRAQTTLLKLRVTEYNGHPLVNDDEAMAYMSPLIKPQLTPKQEKTFTKLIQQVLVQMMLFEKGNSSPVSADMMAKQMGRLLTLLRMFYPVNKFASTSEIEKRDYGKIDVTTLSLQDKTHIGALYQAFVRWGKGYTAFKDDTKPNASYPLLTNFYYGFYNDHAQKISLKNTHKVSDLPEVFQPFFDELATDIQKMHTLSMEMIIAQSIASGMSEIEVLFSGEEKKTIADHKFKDALQLAFHVDAYVRFIQQLEESNKRNASIQCAGDCQSAYHQAGFVSIRDGRLFTSITHTDLTTVLDTIKKEKPQLAALLRKTETLSNDDKELIRKYILDEKILAEQYISGIDSKIKTSIPNNETWVIFDSAYNFENSFSGPRTYSPFVGLQIAFAQPLIAHDLPMHDVISLGIEGFSGKCWHGMLSFNRSKRYESADRKGAGGEGINSLQLSMSLFGSKKKLDETSSLALTSYMRMMLDNLDSEGAKLWMGVNAFSSSFNPMHHKETWSTGVYSSIGGGNTKHMDSELGGYIKYLRTWPLFNDHNYLLNTSLALSGVSIKGNSFERIDKDPDGTQYLEHLYRPAGWGGIGEASMGMPFWPKSAEVGASLGWFNNERGVEGGLFLRSLFDGDFVVLESVK